MSKIVQEYFRDLIEIKDSNDIESDVFNQAISLEKCVKDLFITKKITTTDLKIIQHVIMGYNYSEIAEILKIDRVRVASDFRKVCERIAYILGEDFLDEKFYEQI